MQHVVGLAGYPKQQAEKDKQKSEQKEVWQRTRKERVNRYKGRPVLAATGLPGALIKEPQNEAEAALLLQAMISAGHPGVDFVIGEYNAKNGVDLIVEQIDKDMPTLKWAELVYSLEKLYQWHIPQKGITA